MANHLGISVPHVGQNLGFMKNLFPIVEPQDSQTVIAFMLRNVISTMIGMMNKITSGGKPEQMTNAEAQTPIIKENKNHDFLVLIAAEI